MVRLLLFTIVVGAALTARAETVAPTGRLTIVGEPSAEASLREISQVGLNVEAAGQPRSVVWDDLVSWGTPAETIRGPQWLLTDGGLLVAVLVESDLESLTLQSEDLGRVKVPRDRIRGALFAVPGQMAARDALLETVRGAEAGDDRLWLTNGDLLTGKLRQLGRSELDFESDVGALKVPRENVVALAFDVGAAAPNPRLPFVGLRDGSRLAVSRLTADAKTAQLQLDGGDSWLAPREALVWIRGSSPRVTYLSDVRPTGYRHVPFLEQKWDYRLDRNVTGGPLRSGGELATKGVGLHSTALLSWNVPAGAKRFAARVGIDDSTQGGGSVVFRVFLDGREAASSGPVRGGAAPRDLSVDLGSAKSLSLVVDFADRGDVLDRADWLDARVER